MKFVIMAGEHFYPSSDGSDYFDSAETLEEAKSKLTGILPFKDYQPAEIRDLDYGLTKFIDWITIINLETRTRHTLSNEDDDWEIHRPL